MSILLGLLISPFNVDATLYSSFRESITDVSNACAESLRYVAASPTYSSSTLSHANQLAVVVASMLIPNLIESVPARLYSIVSLTPMPLPVLQQIELLLANSVTPEMSEGSVCP